MSLQLPGLVTSNIASLKPRLLVVDDDPLITDTLGFVLARYYEIVTADSRNHAIQLLRQMDTPPQIALVDLGLPPRPHRPDEGFKLIGDLLAHSPSMRIVVLSGQNDDDNARHARALGAVDFVGKPADPERLRQILDDALRFHSPETMQMVEAADGLIGNSIAIQKLRSQISQYSDSPFPVLIEGESGCGKDIVAGCLHRFSARKTQPFLALNCAAIPPNLVEPTLFGYVKGAFTGAQANKSGYFEEAADGTLFLDEIGELPLELQAKLLRVLENGEYQRVGETRNRISRARVVAATNRDLRREIRTGRFRADLYHRISVFSINVPPLREMGDDKIRLLEHFMSVYAEQAGLPLFVLDAEAARCWQQYSFPGNVRELRNIVIRLMAKFAGSRISAQQLEAEFDVQDDDDAVSQQTAVSPATDTPEWFVRQLRDRHPFQLDGWLRQMESGYIEAALRITRGNVSQAAKLLGVNRTTLYSRMELLPGTIPESSDEISAGKKGEK